jgi:hypothetical protein
LPIFRRLIKYLANKLPEVLLGMRVRDNLLAGFWLPLFCAQHGNLGTAVLSGSDAAASLAALNAARAAIFAQTEPGGTDLLGLGAAFSPCHHPVVPWAAPDGILLHGTLCGSKQDDARQSSPNSRSR